MKLMKSKIADKDFLRLVKIYLDFFLSLFKPKKRNSRKISECFMYLHIWIVEPHVWNMQPDGIKFGLDMQPHVKM